METLAERFDVLQEEILRHIESGDTSLQSHIEYWENVRKENAIMYYARKRGLSTLSLQPLPQLAVSEYNAKQAIKISLTLQALLKSPFGQEPWTLPEVSAELINTPPQNVLKKHGYDVEIWYDDDRQNSMVYTNWDDLYYQDHDEIWHKVSGQVDYDGCYFTDHTGERAYFILFITDARRYSQNGTWTVHFKQQVISSSVVSSSNYSTYEDPLPGPSSNTETPAKNYFRRGSEETSVPSSTTPSTSPRSLRVRRGRGEQGESGTGGEASPKRRRRGGAGSAPTPSEVGSRHRQIKRQGLSRLGLLQEEARDPPIIVVQGSANGLKCWRNRKNNKHASSFLAMSTVWTWVGDTSSNHSRMIIAFSSPTQREQFVKNHLFPRHATYYYGSLGGL
uniref:Regulatory protein E2 n=1 Tax=Gammapapillomavirus 1 TaxID=333926 RepID=A0A2D2AMG3_9PAPI|nr:E2 [Gammapapillomavirus 1]